MDTLFFIASKVIWMGLRPENWLVLLFVLAFAALWRGKLRGARRFLGAGLLGILVVGIVPIGDMLLKPLERRFALPDLPAQITGIVVLGGAEAAVLTQVWQQPVVGDAAERLLTTAALARRYPDARVIFTGGSGALRSRQLTEAQVAAMVLEQAGLSKDRVEFEDKSRNTAENARLAMARAAPTPDQTWLLVTSAFHMPRAIGAFCAQGWKITPYPVDPRTAKPQMGWNLARHLTQLNAGIHEWVGRTVYWATGKTASVGKTGCTSQPETPPVAQ